MSRIHYWHDEDTLKKWKKDYYISTEERNLILKYIKADDDRYISKMKELIDHYYETEIVGGCLHIILDDGNIENSHIEWCAGYSYGVQDHEAQDIVYLLSMMSYKQRKRLLR